MTALEFGSPSTPGQALIRLPERSNLLYATDRVFEHVVHFKEHVKGLYFLNEISPDDFKKLSLQERMIPLGLEDLGFLEKLSFKRLLPEVFMISHEHVTPSSTWSDLYLHDDDYYGWWEVYLISPEFKISNYKMVCVMYNQYTGKDGFPPQRHKLDKTNWDIEIGFVSDEELSQLVLDLSRNKRD